MIGVNSKVTKFGKSKNLMLLIILAISSVLKSDNEQSYSIFHLGNETGNETTPTPARTANVHYPITKMGTISIVGCIGFGFLITVIAVIAYRKRVEAGLNNDPLLPAK